MRSYLLVFSLVVLIFSFVSIADAVLIGQWDFNEGAGNIAYDNSGFSNDATGLNGGWVAGKNGYATTNYNIIVPQDESLLLESNLTIMAWAKIDEFNGLQRRIVEMVPSYGFLFNPPNMDLETAFHLCFNAGTDEENFSFEYQSIPLGEWFHTAVTWDGNIAQFYLNGVPSTPVSAQTIISKYGFSPLLMGAQGYTLDEVRIYNHVLTGEEIRDVSGVVPEPTTMFLFGTGLVGFMFRRLGNKKDISKMLLK